MTLLVALRVLPPALGGALALRGGDTVAAPSALWLSVALSLLSNSMAIVLTIAATSDARTDKTSWKRAMQLVSAFFMALLCYLITYVCTGYVPMGFVQGSAPLFSFGPLARLRLV